MSSSAFSSRFSFVDTGVGKMNIYVYGSVSRGDFVPGSDVDLLAVLDDPSKILDSAIYSVYATSQLEYMWAEGNPFAWHLAIESKLIYAENNSDVIGRLDQPAPYANWERDSKKFYELFVEATAVLAARRDTTVFELSTVFLAIRNFAICYSLHAGDSPVFSRRAYEKLGPASLSLDPYASAVLEGARILSTRGFGTRPTESDVLHVLPQLSTVERWMCDLTEKDGSV